MKKIFLPVGIVAVILLSGCNLFLPKQTDKNVGSGGDVIEKQDVIPPEYVGKEGHFGTFEEEVIGEGKNSILFFTGSDCPECAEHEFRLISWYDNNFIPISVRTVDFDSYVDLRTRYEVTEKDTFVKIDGEGNKISSISFPDEITLLKFMAAQ